jgi:hypothetical protein
MKDDEDDVRSVLGKPGLNTTTIACVYVYQACVQKPGLACIQPLCVLTEQAYVCYYVGYIVGSVIGKPGLGIATIILVPVGDRIPRIGGYTRRVCSLSMCTCVTMLVYGCWYDCYNVTSEIKKPGLASTTVPGPASKYTNPRSSYYIWYMCITNQFTYVGMIVTMLQVRIENPD